MSEANGLVDAGIVDPLDDPREAAAHRARVFAIGAAVPPDSPARVDLADLRAGLALEIAVVPFGEVLVDLEILEAREARRALGAEAGLANTSPKSAGFNRARRPMACSTPWSVRSRSVTDVCCPDLLQAVSPCRTR